MLPSGITHLQRRREYPRRSEAASSTAPSCFRARSRLLAEPGRRLGWAGRWAVALLLKTHGVVSSTCVFFRLSSSTCPQRRWIRWISLVLPLLRTGRRARLPAGGSLKCTQLLHVDWTISWGFCFLWILPMDLHVILKSTRWNYVTPSQGINFGCLWLIRDYTNSMGANSCSLCSSELVIVI